MRYEPNRMVATPLGATDQRSREGELLFPSLFTEEKVQAMEKQLGLYGVAGQLQQRPAPLGGGMFKRWFFEIVAAAPASARRIRFWDKASTDGGGAYTAGVLMAVRDGVYYIEDVVREQLEPFARNRLIKQTAQQDAAKYRQGVTIVIEQEPGSGGKESSLISLRELAGYHVLLDKVQLGKQERALAFASQCGAGNVKIVAPTGTPWLQELLDEFEQFPNGKYKDQVDAATGAFNKLALGGGLLQDIDLFSSEDDVPLTADDIEDLPEVLRDIIEGDWHADDIVECRRARWTPPRHFWN
jgi:predicted phage terminase large subunit-like protein